MGGLSRKDRQGLILIGISSLVVVAILLIRALLPTKPSLDEKTMCPMSGERTRVAVLVDKSDKWGDVNIERVRRVVEEIHRGVPFEGRLSLYVIRGEHSVGAEGNRAPTKVELAFDMCNPGGESECNTLYQNCKKMKKTFREAFEAPLVELAKTLSVPGESNSSPLLETVGLMMNDSRAVDNTIYIVSDLMENHLKFRFYDEVPLDEEMIKEYPISRERNLAVKGFHIERRTHPNRLREAAREAWRGYFQRQGARVEIDPFFVTD